MMASLYINPATGSQATVLHLLCALCKHATSRKIGNLSRFSLFFVLLFTMYITTTYIISNFGEENTFDRNDTGLIEQQKLLGLTVIPNEVVFLPASMKYGETLINCGLMQPCSEGEFAVHIYTGKDHKDEPRLCVDGKYILSKDVNRGGRGINVVIVDNLTKAVVKVSHFDTYEKDSTALETLLLTLRPGDIIILLTFDEPTRKLSRVARLLLYELGSSLIQNLSYRGSWYLVTQKGLTGSTPYEGLHIVESNGWPKHHDVHFCVPFQIKGQAVHPDPLPRINPQRVEFCEKHDDFPLFCDADVINDPLQPAGLIKHSSSVGEIYNTPIIVVTGENILYLPLTLETLVKQSGMNPSLVVIFYLPQHSEVPQMCDLFGFMSVELSPVYSYCDHVKEAFETASLLFPDAKEFVFLGENIVLAPDFLFYMGQALPLLQMDSSILSISAFNENGFKSEHEDLTLIYRVESFSGLAIAVRKDFFQKHWCSNDSESDVLYISNEIKGDNIVPDVSRVLVIPQAYADDFSNPIWSSVLLHKRAVSYADNVALSGVEKMVQAIYNDHLQKLLSTAKVIALKSLDEEICDSNKRDVTVDLIQESNSTGNVYSIYVHQADSADVSSFQVLCTCFRLLHHAPYSPRGLYLNVLRFTWNGKQILAVGSASPFYRHKPADLSPFAVNRSNA